MCKLITERQHLGVRHYSMFVLQTWRLFCNQFEGLVEDFNYGTLLRLDCEKDYTEENTIFGTFASQAAKTYFKK